MKSALLVCTVSVLALLPQLSHGALERVGDFALLDSRGEFHQLSRYQHRRALVLMSYDADCAAMDQLLSRYREAAAANPDLTFLLIDSLDLGRPVLESYGLDLPLLEDDGQLVSESLGVSHAGEVLVLNPRRLTLYYQGPPGQDLDAVLRGVAEESLVDSLRRESSGCPIDYPVKAGHEQAPPDYGTEVAPIIIEHCGGCHRRGGVGPFALDSYIMLLGWSPMIREVLLNKRMPPTQVDPYIGYSASARYLSKQELQTMIHWIDAGAPRGETAGDPLEQLELATDPDWRLGQPDHVVQGPANAIPPTGVMDYVYFDVALPFSEERWIRAVQYQAGDASVLHHLMTFVTGPDEDFWGAERNELSVTRRFVAGYAPGKPNLVEYPEGTGVRIPAGHRLSMQFHYVTNGQSTVDETRLGLYFSARDDLTERLVQAVSSRFVLPPNEPNHEMRAQHVFDQDVVVTGLRARMNFRGKKMKFAVEQADGSLKELLSVPAYNYGWQPHYLLEQPEFIPAGSRVHVIGAFDNSVSNPTNPDADSEVRFGLNSWEEMFTGYFTFHRPAD